MKTYVENAKVERVFQAGTGWGAAIVEERTVGDRTFTQRATLWFKSKPSCEVGDMVNASGFLSVRVRTYEAPSGSKTVADVNLNGAVIQSTQPGAPAAPEDEYPSEDPWASEGPAW